MQSASKWLAQLKAAELHRLAVLIGTPCSGTKAVQIQGIENALSSVLHRDSYDTVSSGQRGDVVSLISIDMGIRNLAYSHWITHFTPSAGKSPRQLARPSLRAWRKFDVSSEITSAVKMDMMGPRPQRFLSDDATTISAAKKESFEPIDYASRAYSFVKTMLDEHKPSHVVIERQRFRSGGRSAVQEWTIRVGVFEGMLYAVLKSLIEQCPQNNKLSVEPILPARVNRFWMEGQLDAELNVPKKTTTATKKAAKEVKQAKIELTCQLLQRSRMQSPDRAFNVHDDVDDIVSAFIERKSMSSKKHKSALQKANPDLQIPPPIAKLDDLADCLLQGLAWVHWQNNRLKLEAEKQNAFPREV